MGRLGLALYVGMLFLALVAPPAQGAPRSADDHFREGYIASTSRDWKKAIEHYTQAIRLDPDNADGFLQRATALEMTGRVDEAIRDYELVLQLRPHHYLALELLAKLHEIKGNHAKAVDLYRRALPLVSDPKWRSVVIWWMSEARRKTGSIEQVSDSEERPVIRKAFRTQRVHRTRVSRRSRR